VRELFVSPHAAFAGGRLQALRRRDHCTRVIFVLRLRRRRDYAVGRMIYCLSGIVGGVEVLLVPSVRWKVRSDSQVVVVRRLDSRPALL
jgi:hypothetical protein